MKDIKKTREQLRREVAKQYKERLDAKSEKIILLQKRVAELEDENRKLKKEVARLTQMYRDNVKDPYQGLRAVLGSSPYSGTSVDMLGILDKVLEQI